MSTGPRFNYFYRVKLTTVAYETTRQEFTYNFVNKTLAQPSTSYVSEGQGYWPILSSVGEVSLDAGEVLPNVTASSIVLRNERGSLGPGRRISDIFERRTPIDQRIDIYVAEVPITRDTVDESDWEQIASGLVGSWEVGLNASEPTLTLNIVPSTFKNKIMNLIVSREVDGMEFAPESSLGRAVPFIIGNNSAPGFSSSNFSSAVIPIRITPDGLEEATFAFRTDFYGSGESNTGNVYLLQNDLGEWKPWNASLEITYFGSPTGSHGLNTYTAQSYKMPIVDNDPEAEAFAVHGVILSGKGNSTNPARVSGTLLSVFVLKVDKVSKSVVDTVASGRVALSAYDAQNNTSTADFDIHVAFDQVAILCVKEGGRTYEYYLGWSATNHGGAQELSLNYISTVVSSLRQDSSDTSSSNNDWRITTGNAPKFVLGTVRRFITAAAGAESFQKGLDSQNVILRPKFFNSSLLGQANPPLDNLPFAIDNLKGVGTVEQLTIDQLVKRLSREWNGTAWVDTGVWDDTLLATSHYAKLYDSTGSSERRRNVAGVFAQETDLITMLSEICRASATRVGYLKNGKAFLWPWGLIEDVKAAIPAHDILPLNWAQRDASTVVNRVFLKLNNSVVLAPKDFENPYFETGGLTYSVEYSADNYPQVAAISEVSRKLFGDKPLVNNQFVVWPLGVSKYIGGDLTEGAVLGEYYLSRFALPAIYCSFVVPFHRYKDLKMFDVITFSHPDFPAYYGTDARARAPYVDTGSSVVSVPDANNGEELVRAKTYRGQIEGISYVMAMEHAPAMRLTVLVLQNHPIDPT